MPYFVIIRGPAGVGKSTISRELAKMIKAEAVHFDSIMREAGMDYIPGEKWIPLKKFLEADRMIIPEVKEKLDKGRNIIIDGNFYHRQQIGDLIKGLECPHLVFTLKASLSECIKRDGMRRQGRLGEQATRDVFKLVNDFDYGIIIDTNRKSPSNIVKEIMSCLPGQKK